MYYATSLMTILAMYKNGYNISNIHQSYSTILIAADSLIKQPMEPTMASKSLVITQAYLKNKDNLVKYSKIPIIFNHFNDSLL